ncbi:aldolase/citrate lyase family protein [Clostridium sp. AM58-1XD]|uniref:HpcH/HpaI aldolase family protein n=1 Tax=Clostridium sp. AM58-1XD TaxID=2292307 RepID=UPI000E538DEA|nr:aldolase/citrate lyase family protein [Clostridium sp. AM58-1XD]RGZ01155.1 hypothetical protein DXA13_02015 [Clostridium sp. AM58-1XD]
MVGLFDSPDMAVILKEAGYDYFFIDSEHGYIDYSKMSAMVTAAKAVDMPVIIRVPQPDREVVLKYMEMGASGLLMPNTETAEQAKKLVEYSKYAPLGNRGVALLKAHAAYRNVKAEDYMKSSNEETILLVQIESPEGVENLDAILGVEGIDAAFVGPNDLSQSMGIMGQYDRDEFQEALECIIKTAEKHGKYSGIHMGNPKAVKKWADKGMSLNLCSSDVALLMETARNHIQAYKE